MNSLKRLLQLHNQLRDIETEIVECESNLLGVEVNHSEYGLCTIIYFDGTYVTLSYDSDDDESHEVEISLEELVK